MRIAVASDDQQSLAAHFGRTRGFVIYRKEPDQLVREDYRPNTFTGHARGGATHDHTIDHHGPILHALADCDVVISHGMGRRIHADLQQAGIQAIITEETSVEQAAHRYAAGNLGHQPELCCNHGGHRDG